jgi:23S rRNA pseudouridine1911/1915/1917 synthase
MRADVLLAARLPWRSRTDIQNLLAAQKITLGGRPVKASCRVRAGDIFWLKIISPEKILGRNEEVELDILYEDEHIVVLNKAPGHIVHPSGRRQAGSIIQAVYLHLAGKMRENPDLRPRLVHRLDRETSGVLVVSKYDAIHRALQQMFEHRRVSKEYLALVEGLIKIDKGRIELPIARDHESRINVKMCVDAARGRRAVSEYRVVERFEGFTLVAVKLLTGRQHQIRVHFAAVGNPVVDDLLYKNTKVFLEYVRRDLKIPAGFSVLGRHALHAHKLSFHYPPQGGEIAFEAPLAEDMALLMDRLRRGGPFKATLSSRFGDPI